MDLLMLIIVILIVAWAFGAFVVPIGGNLIHLLLVVLVIVVLVRWSQGKSL